MFKMSQFTHWVGIKAAGICSMQIKGETSWQLWGGQHLCPGYFSNMIVSSLLVIKTISGYIFLNCQQQFADIYFIPDGDIDL